jgi:hypothetical protein
VGLDWHKFLIKKMNNKFLKKNEMFYVNYPHIDIPKLNLEHWPWVEKEKSTYIQPSEESIKERKEKASQIKEMKRLKREQKTKAKLERKMNLEQN